MRARDRARYARLTPEQKRARVAHATLRKRANKEQVNAANRARYHRLTVQERRAYRNKRKEARRLFNKRWREANREKVKRDRRLKWKSDPSFRISGLLRTRLWYLLKKLSHARSDSAVILLGCSLADFKIYIESKFEPEMSWQNWGQGDGKWNLDHIIPCAIFDFTKSEHRVRCFHFSNYQPMWEPENLSKGAKVSTAQFRLI